MTFDIVTMCYNYQRRWIWQLSSLVEQIDAPDFRIHIAYVKNNGNPKTEDIIDFYTKRGLTFIPTVYDSIDDMAYRGYVRNKQNGNCTAEWIYYNDPDHVYPRNWLHEISDQLKILGKMEKVFNQRYKITTSAPETQHVIDQSGPVFQYMGAYEQALQLPTIDIHVRGVAGGNMMVVNRELMLRKAGGVFMNPEKNSDLHIFQQRTWSDIRFRAMIGRTCGLHLSEKQIHLNHFRVTDGALYNTEAQR